LGQEEEILDANGLRGTRSRFIERTRGGRVRVAGDLVFNPTPVELTTILPWALGAAAAGNVYALADALPARYVVLDKVMSVFTYDGCKVDTLRIRGTEGGFLEVTLGVVAKAETPGAAGTFPALTLDSSAAPFVFTDLVLDVGGTTTQSRSFELTVENRINRDRFLNSRYLTEATAMDRQIRLSLEVPYGDAPSLYFPGAAGVAATATFTNGPTSLVLTMPRVVFPARQINIPGREELFLRLEGQCYREGATMELQATLDSAPGALFASQTGPDTVGVEWS
jgi:hypothetical protein